VTAPERPVPGGWEIRLLAIVTATLVVFGIAAVYGASSLVAVQRGEPGSWFAVRQLAGASFGGIIFLAAARVDYHIWQRLAWPLVALAVAALAIPFVPGLRALTPEINGARRWIDLGFVTVQPSEVAKFAVVAWTAMLATKKGDRVRELKYGLVPFMVVVAPLCVLVLLEPDLSTALDLALIAGLVLFVAGARIGHFLLLGLIAIPLLWREIATVPYRLSRVLTFLSPGGDTQEASWQITQSLVGIGAGQVFGVGFGEGLQKLGYLPYAYSDFIFSTIGEEWGFIGVCLVALLFSLFLWMGFRIARTAPDTFGMLLAVGLTGLVGSAAIVHMAVTLALVPTTGLPLPFISFGRSSLVVSLLAAGVLVSIGRPTGTGRQRRDTRTRVMP
jgi:cell division protein FtsW